MNTYDNSSSNDDNTDANMIRNAELNWKNDDIILSQQPIKKIKINNGNANYHSSNQAKPMKHKTNHHNI